MLTATEARNLAIGENSKPLKMAERIIREAATEGKTDVVIKKDSSFCGGALAEALVKYGYKAYVFEKSIHVYW